MADQLAVLDDQRVDAAKDLYKFKVDGTTLNVRPAHAPAYGPRRRDPRSDRRRSHK
jgi:hypothetical protein